MLLGACRGARLAARAAAHAASSSAAIHSREVASAQDDGPSKSGGNNGTSGRPRPRSPIAMAHFDYQLELEARIEEGGSLPDTEAAFEILANHRIREAMKDGEFDNLPGKGRPLCRSDDSSDISMKVLKNANAVPEWVEVGKGVRERLRRLRANIEPFVKEVVETQPESLADGMRRLKATPRWVQSRGGLQLSVDSLNADIIKHNRMAPSAVMHMMPIKLETEVSAMYMKLRNG